MTLFSYSTVKCEKNYRINTITPLLLMVPKYNSENLQVIKKQHFFNFSYYSKQ